MHLTSRVCEGPCPTRVNERETFISTWVPNSTARPTSHKSTSNTTPTTSLKYVSHSIPPVHTPSASPYTDQRGEKLCKHLHKRREWRTLDNSQKADYIRAIKCIQKRPAINPVIKQAKSRFEEFQAYHIQQADYIHLVGQFLPWHRYFTQLYEKALRDECGYQGYTPYWDWSKDADASTISGSPVFDPVTGFGGDGVPGTYTLPTELSAEQWAQQFIFADEFRGCVRDGPFANLTLHLGPGTLITTHCLTRGIHNENVKYLNSQAVANVTRSTNYNDFWIQLSGRPLTPDFRLHDGGHRAIGGDGSSFYSSPAEPLFHLHHANLDRIWWNWQQLEASRLYEISGRSTINPPYTNVTLDYPLQMSETLGPTIPLWQVMNIHSERNCYTYV